MQFINIINENLGNVRGQDLYTEALLYAFGSLDEKYELNINKELNAMVQNILENHVFNVINME